MTEGTIVRFAGIAKEFMVYKTIDLGFITIRWYALIIVFGLILAALLGGRIAYTWKINLSKMVDVLLYGLIGGIIGARLYFVVFRLDYYLAHPLDIIKIWEGGLAIYGGIIGGIVCAYIVCRVEKINFLNLLDMVGISLLVGQGIGRWGNFANQEAFGTITYKNWGMMSDTIAETISQNASYYGLENVKNIPDYISQNDLYVHPTFFYESVWCLLGVLVIYIVMKKFRRFSGQMFLCYGVWYGAERMIVEGLRYDSLYIPNTTIRVSQLLSAVLMLVCLVLLIVFTIKFKRHPKPIEGVDFFPEPTEKEKEALERRQKKKEMKKRMKNTVIRDGRIVWDGNVSDEKSDEENLPEETAQQETVAEDKTESDAETSDETDMEEN